MTRGQRPASSRPATGADPERLGRLEQQMAVAVHRLDDMSTRHETVPTRVSMLEQQFRNTDVQLKALGAGQAKLTVAVNEIGSKVTRLLTILTIAGCVLQMAVPALLRVWLP